MITKCNYCDYQKSTPAPENLLRVSYNEPEGKEKAIWMERLIKTMGFSDYHSVKIHMGRKHKGLFKPGESPTGIWEQRELEIMKGVENHGKEPEAA